MLPPEFREEVLRHSPEGRLMLTNFDGAVSGYPMPEWEKIELAFQGANKLSRQMRNLERFLLSGAMEVTLDKQGRILIPPHLRRYASLDKELVLAGLGAKFEIWDQDRFEERRREMEESFDEDMAALAENGIDLPL
jgi:MraZ protein